MVEQNYLAVSDLRKGYGEGEARFEVLRDGQLVEDSRNEYILPARELEW